MGITLKELKAAASPDVAALNADVFAGGAQLRNAGDLGAAAEQALEAMQPSNALAARFEHLWAEWGGLPLTKEYKFSAARRWRLDYYIESGDVRVGVELNGGVWSEGRHVRGRGFLNDLEKLNAAQMAGIVVLQLGTGQVDAAHVAELADYVNRRMKQVSA
jgi:hypothetical protein